MSKSTKPRLGRGLSSLLSSTMEIEAPTTPPTDPSTSQLPGTGGEQSAGPDVRWIPLAQITVSPFQPRRQPEQAELETLAASIRSMGVMQPVLVRPVPSSEEAGGQGGVEGWELVAGERRWRAAHIARLEMLPASVIDIDDKEAAEWGITENLQREDLSAIEQGWALRQLVDRFGQTHAEIASRLGIARASVSNLIRLTDLDTELQEMILRGDLSAGHAKVLLGIENEKSRKRFARQTIKRAWSVRALEDAVNKANSATAKKSSSDERPADIAELERQLAEHLGTKVRLRTSRDAKRGSLTIEFFGPDGFDDLARRLGFVMRS